MRTTTDPSADVVGVHTNGLAVNRVMVRCPFCRGVHSHPWQRGTAHPQLHTLRAVYRITISTRERIEAMREYYAAPDGCVGLVPLQIGFAFEIDGPDQDVVGIVLHTALGKFAVWLPLQSAIPRELTLLLAESVRRYGEEHMVPRTPDNTRGDPRVLGRTIRQARGSVEGLPATFSFHDLRHYLASLLIASGADIKTVQARLRHASASTTLNTYAHLWPDADESTRAAVATVIRERMAAGQ